MVAFSFKQRFALLVESGVKRQTIRQTARAKRGDLLQLYVGMRTKSCRKLVTPDPVCTLVDYVGIRPDYLTLGNKALHEGDADDFAKRDGFANFNEMVAWFADTYGSPYFQGYVHLWAPSSGDGETTDK
jgi:hypothetical protein